MDDAAPGIRVRARGWRSGSQRAEALNGQFFIPSGAQCGEEFSDLANTEYAGSAAPVEPPLGGDTGMIACGADRLEQPPMAADYGNRGPSQIRIELL